MRPRKLTAKFAASGTRCALEPAPAPASGRSQRNGSDRLLVVLFVGWGASACGEDRIEHYRGGNASTNYPASPPARVCGDSQLLSGPATAPTGAVTVPAGDNSKLGFSNEGATYWFAPGVHTLGDSGLVHIVPGNHSTFLGGPGAILDGQGRNRYAFAGNSTHVAIRYLTVRNFAAEDDEGVLNHDSADNWTFEFCTVQDNGGAGVMLGSNNVVRDCCISNNGQFGFHAYKCSNRNGVYPRDCANLGPGTGTSIRNLLIEHSEITGSDLDDQNTHDPGCQCSGGGTFWDVDGAVIRNNWIHHNLVAGLMADANCRNFQIESNYIEENGAHAIRFTTGYNAQIAHNTIKRNALLSGPLNAGFPEAAVYVSESGGDPIGGGANSPFQILQNHFEDNWNGITIWEDANRFCNYPETGYCTLHFGSGYDTSPCSEQNIAANSANCRWKSQNVLVTQNLFRLEKATIDCVGGGCGHNAIVSNFGASPAWSPYLGTSVQEAVTFTQNNVFRSNTYLGEWGFTVVEPGRQIDWETWRSAPYKQDSGSDLTR